jgi:uncharacterized membrane protein YfcA
VPELKSFCQILEKHDFQEVNNFNIQGKRVYVVLMGIVLGVFVTLSSVGAGAFGVMALILMFPNLPMIRIIGSDVVHAVLLTLWQVLHT